MSDGRHFPIQSFLWSIVLVAVAAVSVYLGYELVVVPQRALQDQIREQKETIGKLEQEKQRLEAYLKILKHIDRRARVEVLRQAKDPLGQPTNHHPIHGNRCQWQTDQRLPRADASRARSLF